MISITLSFGGTVAGLALGQFGQANSSGAVALSVQEKSALSEVAFVYAAASQTSGCPIFQGASEGATLNVTLFDYGDAPFAPVEAILNGTLHVSDFNTVRPGSMGWVAVPLGGACAHADGQNVVLADAHGGEIQFVT
jgi:hypothetical protein